MEYQYYNLCSIPNPPKYKNQDVNEAYDIHQKIYQTQMSPSLISFNQQQQKRLKKSNKDQSSSIKTERTLNKKILKKNSHKTAFSQEFRQNSSKTMSSINFFNDNDNMDPLLRKWSLKFSDGKFQIQDSLPIKKVKNLEHEKPSRNIYFENQRKVNHSICNNCLNQEKLDQKYEQRSSLIDALINNLKDSCLKGIKDQDLKKIQDAIQELSQTIIEAS